MSVTRSGDHRVRAFMVRLPSGAGYWTVLDEDLAVVAAADAFLRQVRFGRDGAESTTKAYAGAIALFLRWGARTGRDWQGGGGELGLFMTWLLHAGPQVSGAGAFPGAAVLTGPGSAPARSARRVNGILAAVRGMIVHAVTAGTAAGPLVRLLFEVADDVDLPAGARAEDGSTGWRVRPRHRLHEPERPVDRAGDGGIVAVLGGCCSARDRLIVLLMARAGLRRGEVLGLRRSDVHLLADSRELGCDVARAHLHVVRRDDNPNWACRCGWTRSTTWSPLPRGGPGPRPCDRIRCGMRSPRTSWMPAARWRRRRICSGMPASPRRRSTLTPIRRGCAPRSMRCPARVSRRRSGRDRRHGDCARGAGRREHGPRIQRCAGRGGAGR